MRTKEVRRGYVYYAPSIGKLEGGGPEDVLIREHMEDLSLQ